MSWRVSGLEVKVAKNTRSGKYYLEMPYRTSKTQKKGMPKARSSQWDDTWHTAEAARAAIPEFRGKVAKGFAPVGGGGKRTKPEKSLEAIFVSPERQSKRLKSREASTSTSVAATPMPHKPQPPPAPTGCSPSNMLSPVPPVPPGTDAPTRPAAAAPSATATAATAATHWLGHEWPSGGGAPPKPPPPAQVVALLVPYQAPGGEGWTVKVTSSLTTTCHLPPTAYRLPLAACCLLLHATCCLPLTTYHFPTYHFPLAIHLPLATCHLPLARTPCHLLLARYNLLRAKRVLS